MALLFLVQEAQRAADAEEERRGEEGGGTGLKSYSPGTEGGEFFFLI